MTAILLPRTGGQRRRSALRRAGLRPLLPLAVLLLGACSDGYVRFPVTPADQAAEAAAYDVIPLTAANIGSFSQPARGHAASGVPFSQTWTYTVGAGDILSVIVFDHPELTLPAGPERSAEESGFQVQADGTFTYPFVGRVSAAGRTTEEIRAELTERLREFIPDPNLEVRVASYNAQSVVVAGEVEEPNRQPLTSVPKTLVEAVNAAGGFGEAADLRRVALQRRGGTYLVDVQGFLAGGLRQNNPVLRDGDVVFVPRRQAEEAYLLGEVARPDVVDLSQGPVSLTQAVARQGGLNGIRADARGIFVFRLVEGRTRVFQLDITSPAGLLLGTRFVLEPGDVVYIVRSPLQRWNDTISRLLPTVGALGAVDDLGTD